MNLKGMIRTEYVDERGVRRVVLVKDSFQDMQKGIPLMCLEGLELPQDMEDTLVKYLQDFGIWEYSDALKVGGADLIAQAIRAMIRASVQSILTICQGEYKMLQEAGYEHK